ncbi:MAG TPA: DUF928 domain-containing protein [Candidatus Methylacidiphilales bacterium]|jgi:hypothetical protein|nr:DUF928 domain-containing protein [Candidatus Methylacidiphilales bacterium]
MKLLLLVSGLVLAMSATSSFAQTNAPPSPAPPASGAPVPAPPRLLIFHAPAGDSGGILPIRVGGGSRGGAADDLSIEVLVPDHVALTTQAQPSLYWYQSKEAKTQCEVSVTEPKNPKPLLLLKSSAVTPAGIHAIRLSKFDIKLKPNVVYRWSVAVVVDPRNRSQDIIANGVIKRIDPSPELAGKLGQASETDKPALYAENGIWYDALQSISDQIDHAPQDASLRQERAGLLKQIGMDGVKMDADLSKSP